MIANLGTAVDHVVAVSRTHRHGDEAARACNRNQLRRRLLTCKFAGRLLARVIGIWVGVLGEDELSLRAGNHAVLPALISAVGLSVAALAASPPAAAKWPAAEPCVSPSGLTLQQEYGYSAVVVSSDCTQIPVGQKWAASIPWIVASRFEQKPSGFTTDYATPVDDFRGKLESIEYTVDAGTAQQANRSFPGDNKIWTGQLPSAPGQQAINTVGLGSIDPLPLGAHTVDVSWKLTAPHCDGFSADQGTSCLPQGETLVKRITFTVVDPHASNGQT
jgi:hypothetical protein